MDDILKDNDREDVIEYCVTKYAVQNYFLGDGPHPMSVK